jgi:hypothetical protein
MIKIAVFSETFGSMRRSSLREVIPCAKKRRLKMKIIPLLLSVALLLPVHSHAATPPAPPPSTLGVMRVSLLDGDVQIKTEETGDWVPASINMPLRDGDQLWVPEGGRAELQLKDGSFLRLDQKTALDVLRVDPDAFQFYLAEGRVFSNYRGLKGSLLQVATPISSVRAYESGVFRMDVSEEGQTEISVYTGSVYAESQDGKTTVTEGNTLLLKGESYAEVSPLGPADEWENWNRERDQKYAQRRTASPYLPAELQPYSRDFDENGRWVRTPEYGYVWTPTVVASAEWAPYRVGRWVWIGGDYVWISYERWGWAPYHYGRWAFVGPIGWCWVPPQRGAVYWGPGFVGWVQTPTFVSWVPLAPREIYYGRGYYGPYSVNLVNVNVRNIDVTRVRYRNIHVHNAVTVIHHDTFVTGRHVDFHVKENPFVRERIHLGRPEIRPERATMAPVIREIHERHRPPSAIREMKVREIRERRPLVKDREVSVFRRERSHKEMDLKTREIKPADREIGKSRERWPRPPEKEVFKPRGPVPGEKGAARPRGRSSETGMEKPGREMKASDKEIGKPRGARPLDKEIGAPREPGSAKKEFTGPTGSGPEGALEKPGRERPSVEKGADRPRGGRGHDRDGERRKD